jgi:hypothetical protein
MATLSTGYRGNPGWRDMSEYAVHFTKGIGAASEYDVMMKILWESRILPGGPFGAARNLAEIAESQKSACFSEIPLDLLARLVDRRSLYGIGFRQDLLVGHGGTRVWYLDKGGAAAAAFQALVRDALAGEIDSSAPIWRLTPFVDFPGDYAGGPYRFEWEREWRVPGGVAFNPDDVAFLFVPESLHEAARTFFEGHLASQSGPAYLCPYIDPRWDMPRIQAEFAKVASPPIAPVPMSDEDVDDSCPYCGGPTYGGMCLLCGGIS